METDGFSASGFKFSLISGTNPNWVFWVSLSLSLHGICILYFGLLDYFDIVGLLKLVDMLFKYEFD